MTRVQYLTISSVPKTPKEILLFSLIPQVAQAQTTDVFVYVCNATITDMYRVFQKFVDTFFNTNK